MLSVNRCVGSDVANEMGGDEGVDDRHEGKNDGMVVGRIEYGNEAKDAFGRDANKPGDVKSCRQLLETLESRHSRGTVDRGSGRSSDPRRLRCEVLKCIDPPSSGCVATTTNGKAVIDRPVATVNKEE